MKNNLVKILFTLALLAAFAAPVFAANNNWTDPANDTSDPAITDDTGTQGPGLSYDTLKFSSNVQYYYLSSATGDSFAIATFNTKGTKVYGSNSESSKIYATVDEHDDTSYTDVVPVASGDWASGTWAEVGK